MSDSRPLLEAHRLCKRYGDFALRNVDLTVCPGEIVGYVGRNGAGKTTTIKALLGLIRPDGGEGTVMGAPIREMGRSEGVAAKELLGVVFDTLAFPDALRIRDINGVLQRCYRQWDERRFRAYLKRFDLQDTKKVKELSRGMGMKLSLACALSHGARLLILDEATAGLSRTGWSASTTAASSSTNRRTRSPTRWAWPDAGRVISTRSLGRMCSAARHRGSCVTNTASIWRCRIGSRSPRHSPTSPATA